VSRVRLGNGPRRLRLTLVVLCAVALLFAGRLVQVQGFDASAYADQAKGIRLHRTVLPAERGAITDRHGVELAASIETYKIAVDPLLLRTEGKINAAAGTLAPLLDQSDHDIREQLGRTDKRYVVVAKNVPPHTYREIQAAAHAQRIPGIVGELENRRTYPAGNLAGSLVGYVDIEGRGSAGIELSEDEVLAGTDGLQVYEQSSGRPIPAAAPQQRDPVPGRDVQLTLDRDIQYAAQQAITEEVAATAALSGNVIVMRPNGEILALATAPSVDPNDVGATPEDERGNPAVSEVYEPGSTAKIITAAAGVETGTVTPETVFSVPNSLPRAGETFNDSTSHGGMSLTFAGVIAKSSNIGTILASELMPTETLEEYHRRFGIGEPTNVGLQGESRGILPRIDQWTGSQRYTIPFGQGYSVNSIQMASAYATIANGGVRVQPHLVAGYRAADGTVESVTTPRSTRVVTAETARTVAAMLEGVTGPEGTAKNVAIDGYRIAGKTGTAQRVGASGGYDGYTASFIGFAPADAPEVVVSVVLQDPKNGYSGGGVAGPVFTQVMSFALQALKVPPTGTEPPGLRLFPE
jgi:cell division protein FtsI (penicillin-binding protein 3)